MHKSLAFLTSVLIGLQLSRAQAALKDLSTSVGPDDGVYWDALSDPDINGQVKQLLPGGGCVSVAYLPHLAPRQEAGQAANWAATGNWWQNSGRSLVCVDAQGEYTDTCKVYVSYDGNTEDGAYIVHGRLPQGKDTDTIVAGDTRILWRKSASDVTVDFKNAIWDIYNKEDQRTIPNTYKFANKGEGIWSQSFSSVFSPAESPTST